MIISHQQISPNFYRVKLGDFYFWFSYETLIAARIDTPVVYVDSTFYSKTTSKHKNYLKESFSNYKEVEKGLLETLVEATLTLS